MRCTLSIDTLVFGGLLFVLAGCTAPQVSDTGELAAFLKAGPVQPHVDVNALVKAKLRTEQYRVIRGDVLRIQMPAVMHAVTPQEQVRLTTEPTPHLCRVDDGGKITLPAAGKIEAAGKTLNRIEREIADVYHPRYVVHPPSVVVTVEEYETVKVSVTGAVQTPGVYELRSDEMSLVSALMKAGGIVQSRPGREGGASSVRIYHGNDTDPETPLVLPVEGLNVPFADIALKGGESIEVERLNPHVISVLGHVNRSGTFPYPPGARYTIPQAIAMAQGRDKTADPQFIMVYRQNPSNGRIVSAVFNIGEERGFEKAAGIFLKPGDVVLAAQTPRTEFRRIFSDLFRGFHAGITYPLDDL